jgi:hypothetical protein
VLDLAPSLGFLRRDRIDLGLFRTTMRDQQGSEDRQVSARMSGSRLSTSNSRSTSQ